MSVWGHKEFSTDYLPEIFKSPIFGKTTSLVLRDHRLAFKEKFQSDSLLTPRAAWTVYSENWQEYLLPLLSQFFTTVTPYEMCVNHASTAYINGELSFLSSQEPYMYAREFYFSRAPLHFKTTFSLVFDGNAFWESNMSSLLTTCTTYLLMCSCGKRL